MKHWKILTVLMLLGFATLSGNACAAASEPVLPMTENNKQALTLGASEFGTFENGDGDEVIFQPGSIIPGKVGQQYGWIIQVNTNKRSLAVSEEYVLPSPENIPPPEDDVAKNLYVPDLRRMQVSVRQLVPVDGQIVGHKVITADDHPGPYRLKLTIEGGPSATFNYEIR